MKKKEKSIFRTILTAMLMVLGIEILLLVAALSISHVSSQLDQNAVDILKKQKQLSGEHSVFRSESFKSFRTDQ